MASTTLHPAPARSPARTLAAPHLLTAWHLLSLDAPTVAALWTWFTARAFGLHLPATSVASMFVAVWILYAADRLLDARALDMHLSRPGSVAALEARHYFHRQHRAAFLAGIVFAALVLAALLPRLNRFALVLFGIEAGLLAVWFFLLHITPLARHLPKELALGPFFSAAIYIPAFARDPSHWAAMLPGAGAFAVLCTLNCVFIHRWEPSPFADPPHPTTRFAAQHVRLLACAFLGLCLLAVPVWPAAWHTTPQIPCACAAAAAALLALDRLRSRMHRTAVRAAADLALLTPLLLLPFRP